MTVYWVRTENDSALSAMEAVERALREGDTGTPATPAHTPAAASAGSGDPAVTDPYLTENMAALRTNWSVDPQRIVVSKRPGLAAAINGFQRLARRATWWYDAPQWQQISEFHASVVRVVDWLLAHQRQLSEQLANGGVIADRTQALEEEIYLLRMEQFALRNRIAELEARLAMRSPERSE
jgi:hypothetical protein